MIRIEEYQENAICRDTKTLVKLGDNEILLFCVEAFAAWEAPNFNKNKPIETNFLLENY